MECVNGDGSAIEALVVSSPTIDADYWTGGGTARVLVLNAWLR